MVAGGGDDGGSVPARRPGRGDPEPCRRGHGTRARKRRGGGGGVASRWRRRGARVPETHRDPNDTTLRACQPRVADGRKPAHGGGHDRHGVTFSGFGANDVAGDADRAELIARPLRWRVAAPILVST